MSCRELERLFVAGAAEAQIAAHRAGCSECDRAGREVDEAASWTHDLKAPLWSPALRASLLEIPRLTVSCEGADALLARAVEGEVAASDQSRLEKHLSRCAACTEAAGTLFAMRDLTAPVPPPWLATRLAAARPPARTASWRRIFSGRAVVAYAYAAAMAVMLLGLNPTAVARKAGFARLSESTRVAVTVAQNSIGDRLGALQERAFRELEVWKGRVTGYGRAAVSNALAIVWRPEKKGSTRPRLGKEGGTGAPSDEFLAADLFRRELLTLRFRV